MQGWIVLALVIVGALGTHGSAAAQGKTLTVATAYDVVTLDPAINTSTTTARIIAAGYERLLRYRGASTEVEGELAESWTVSDDGLVYTFKLRPNVTFHDGTPLTAQAVADSFARLLKINKGPASLFFEKVKGVEAVDASRVRFTIAHPWPPFLSTLAIAKGPFIVSPTAVQKNAKGDDLGQEFLRSNVVGTGPYKLQSWEPGQQVVLVKNEAYWRGWSGAHVDRVVVRYVKEYTTRRQLLLRGDVDLIDAPSLDDLASLRRNPDLVVADAPTLNMDYILFNLRKPALADVRMRQAIAQAIDVDGALKSVMRGEGIAAAGPLAPMFPEHNRTLKPLAHDPARAKQIVAQVQREKNLKSEDLTFDFLYWTGEDRLRQLGEVVKANLADVGITVNLRELAWPAYQSTMFNPKEVPGLAFNSGWLVYAEPSAALRTYFQSRSTYNWGGYESAKVDQLLNDADRARDAARRAQTYRDLQKAIHDDVVWVPLWAMKVATPMRKWVKGFTFNPIYMAWTSFYDLSVDR